VGTGHINTAAADDDDDDDDVLHFPPIRSHSCCAIADSANDMAPMSNKAFCKEL